LNLLAVVEVGDLVNSFHQRQRLALDLEAVKAAVGCMSPFPPIAFLLRLEYLLARVGLAERQQPL
jgi:hypothetical protein